jgi:DNA-binding NarL/FixJ family response regulator
LGGRVLVIEDVEALRGGLIRALEAMGYETFGVGTLQAARRLVCPEGWRRQAFDVLIVDVKLPDGDSLPVVEVAVELDPSPVVAVITAYLDDTYALTFARLGALYLPKPLGSENLVELMRLIEQQRMDLAARYGREHSLSTREIEVLRHALKAMSYEETALAMGVGVETVKTHWKRIAAKTGKSSRTKVVSDVVAHFARGKSMR